MELYISTDGCKEGFNMSVLRVFGINKACWARKLM